MSKPDELHTHSRKDDMRLCGSWQCVLHATAHECVSAFCTSMRTPALYREAAEGIMQVSGKAAVTKLRGWLPYAVWPAS